jgi:hypothetical protein
VRRNYFQMGRKLPTQLNVNTVILEPLKTQTADFAIKPIQLHQIFTNMSLTLGFIKDTL